MNDEELEQVYYEVMILVEKLLKNEKDPLSIAAVMMNQALGLYKSILSDDEYNLMIKSIIIKKNQIVEYKTRTLH